MSVLTNYVERLEHSIARNLSILTGEVAEFELLCRQVVESGDALAGRQARQGYQRALARFEEMEKVSLVLAGPRYRRLTEPAPHRESSTLALRARYYQAFLPVERRERWDSHAPRLATPGDREPQVEPPLPFATPKAKAAFQSMVDHLAPGEVVSFALLQGEPAYLDALPHAPFGPRGVVERHGAREVRAAIHHPLLLTPPTLEAIVYDRLLGRSPVGRAVIFRLHDRDDLTPPFLSALRLHLARLAPGTVLTVNPATAAVA
ncbi:MAG: hypothetical protein COW73_05885 [Nitrospirae bacterium CG18_big_fil_WC_8_21_14_2_50_70_55]|nr:hypothetical protein [Deltaproteobacteria bacterium]OIP63942.1 MAG: hypothetical protein AUK30_07585 [Nitrospirae bacterium CG2_30_70_394]PIQ05378.1 MAG: hypothetical protein COW73_05885 [Nitrospirae bacterium CG18_big_fil_WC_8_21_14_2_50_70_55]PIU80059.1 MAG: hypothetical protein COS73_01345 [Nitrospirae bacterium CG06_land_8_20_14_3_00_70_43]PIW83499.1 MAG: hypothetical protein COZ96_02950 [Nitrospirae bacterium CG_4_8_14_3_um_filter_70_85]PIX83522.1 MAG: hypothetical protein COZ33_05070 